MYRLYCMSRDIILDVIQAAQTNATCEFAELTFNRERKFREQLEEKEVVFRTIFGNVLFRGTGASVD